MNKKKETKANKKKIRDALAQHDEAVQKANDSLWIKNALEEKEIKALLEQEDETKSKEIDFKYYYFTYQYQNGFGSCSCRTSNQFYINQWRKYIDKKHNVSCIITNFIEITAEQFDEFQIKE